MLADKRPQPHIAHDNTVQFTIIGRCLRQDSEPGAKAAPVAEGGRQQMASVQEIIHATGALDYTARRAREAADSAKAELATIPDNEYCRALMALADFAVQRRS